VAPNSVDILTDPPPPDADARVPYGVEPLQFGDLRLPADGGPHPLVVVVHGGYWQAIHNLTHLGHLCVDLAACGVATWNVEYRRVGDPGGGYPGTLQDVADAFAYVPELAGRFPLDLGRVAAFGHSAGGQLALLAALRTELGLKGIVSAAGVLDLHETDRRGDDRGLITRLLGGGPDALPERWRESSPRTRLPLGVRQLVAVGSADTHFEPNRAYAEAARVAGDEVEFIAFEGASHFELVDPEALEWQALRSRLRDLLG